jgi:hypothetical protein
MKVLSSRLGIGWAGCSFPYLSSSLMGLHGYVPEPTVIAGGRGRGCALWVPVIASSLSALRLRSSNYPILIISLAYCTLVVPLYYAYTFVTSSFRTLFKSHICLCLFLSERAKLRTLEPGRSELGF